MPLQFGPARGSLLDDDDDELVDYFGAGAPRAGGPAAPVPEDAARSSSRWHVRDCDIPALPSFYPLERSSVFVPQASAHRIAARITTVLQARSSVAYYDARNAKVDCVSAAHVEFRVRLYRGQGKGRAHGVIVEVQRRAGFDLGYAQDVYAILDAAEGKALPELVQR